MACQFWVTVTLTSDLVLRIIMFGAFFSILFELGIPNLVCGCILGWQGVMYQFCDLDLVSRIIVSGAYPILFLYRNPKFGVLIPLGMAEWCIPFLVTLTLTSGLIFWSIYPILQLTFLKCVLC